MERKNLLEGNEKNSRHRVFEILRLNCVRKKKDQVEIKSFPLRQNKSHSAV